LVDQAGLAFQWQLAQVHGLKEAGAATVVAVPKVEGFICLDQEAVGALLMNRAEDLDNPTPHQTRQKQQALFLLLAGDLWVEVLVEVFCLVGASLQRHQRKGPLCWKERQKGGGNSNVKVILRFREMST
jgi:hypothetical protein